MCPKNRTLVTTVVDGLSTVTSVVDILYQGQYYTTSCT